MSIPIGLGRKHSNGKVNFSSSNPQTVTLAAKPADEKMVNSDLNPNPDSTYIIYLHNATTQTATIKVYNEWEDTDGNTRWVDLTSGGDSLAASTTDFMLIEGMFFGKQVKIEVDIGTTENNDFFYSVRRP